ncbi:MAG: hypothetical protein HZB42_11085 [Sphingobacteriales bacterium]|nr:hypothetical protein [Sphingobacteriales bacterium]
MKTYKTVVTIFLLFAILQLSAQKTDSALTDFVSKFPQEKIYVHYDREYYIAGETIWFKAYLYNNGKPSDVSNNLYLQLINNKGQVIANKKFPVLGAVAKGNIDLHDSLPQDNYYIRAFTPAMLNTEEALLYKKNIFVFRPAGATQNQTSNVNQTVSLQFFPESGNLVDGIMTTVAFKATDQWGMPVDVSGTIKTETGTVITNFSSYHDGIGKIAFAPQVGKKYIAEAETAAGKRTYQLPEVRSSGINLHIEDEKGSKKIQLSRSEQDKISFDNLLLVAQINNQVVFETEIAFEDYPSVIGHLGTDSLPSGILHFTVFNKDRIPLAERLAFVDNGEYRSAASIAAVKTSFEKRGANEIEIIFPDAAMRSCSAAIIDMPSMSFNDKDNIVSRFLLTGDLKGYIYNPAWYFVQKDSFGEKHADSTASALDNLMLTHGWSRFNWTKLLAGEYVDKRPEDLPFISVSGQVVDERTRQPLSGGKLNMYLIGADSSESSYEAMVNGKGQFRLDSLFFAGKSKFHYAYTDYREKQRPALVIPDEVSIEKIMNAIVADITANTISRHTGIISNKTEIDNRFTYVQSKLEEVKELERVTVQSKTKKRPIEQVNEKYATGVFSSQANVELDNINQPANDKSLNVVEYIKNNIHTIDIQNGQFVNQKNFSLMTGQKWLIGIFLDEAPANIGLLQTIRMQDVALIKFYEAGFVGVGSSYPGGAVAVYTKEKIKEEKPDKWNYFERNGYAVSREFYNPDYSPAGPKQPTTDNRTTLYWNPNVYTEQGAKSVKLYFYNNDFSKKFKVVVEGFDAEGRLIHAEKLIGN